jgi:hypothetical protein
MISNNTVAAQICKVWAPLFPLHEETWNKIWEKIFSKYTQTVKLLLGGGREDVKQQSGHIASGSTVMTVS